MYETIRRRNSKKKGEMKRKCLETLRRVRREKDFSQEYIAEKLNLTQKAYSDIENGKTTLKSDIILILKKAWLDCE